MTIHVLHAGDGYLYLIRSVAAHDGQLAAGESLSAYYMASGQPPGRWTGAGARRLDVRGVVTEAQMRALFGEGLHPDAASLKAQLMAAGMAEASADRAVRLGRRFPQYGSRKDLTSLARDAYEDAEAQLGRPLTEAEKFGARQRMAAAEFERRVGRAPLDPIELASLGDRHSTREAVAGYDLVFTPVKSVTSLWGIASAETRNAMFEAHNEAVADAIEWLETHVALTRTGNSGQAQINTLGVTAALFHHWDSRAGDPDLHTHVAISNKVQGPDEKWRSLDGRTLFAAAVSMSERYNTRIEDELRHRLGVQFEERVSPDDGRRPVREIVGMPTAVIENFSKRRQGIEQQYQGLLRQYQADHGREPAISVRHQLYQQATLTERPDKQRGRSLQHMVGSWQREAATLLNRSDVAAAIEQMTLGRKHIGPASTPDEIADRALDCVMATRATWNVHHVRAEAHRQSREFPTDERDALVECVVAAAMSPQRSVRIETPRTLPEPAELRRTDGESVFVEHGSTLFTSARILEAERRITEAAKLRTGERVEASMVEAALARSADTDRPLNTEQAGMVRAFCQSGRAVQLGLAPAGSGKTTAMRVVADAWMAANRPVVALAPSAVAADVLAEELGIEADTLAKFDHSEPLIQPGTMILIDEAGMAGTLMLARVVDRALEAGAVVRLLGDDHQLAAIEAGGVLRHLDHEVGSVRLHQVVRFADLAEATATLQVRDGVTDAVDFYLSHNRVTAGNDASVPDVAYAAWLADVHEGKDSVLMASSATTVAELNARARVDLVISGQVQVDGLALRDGNVAAVGDQICTRRNARRLAVNRGRDWVKNGDGWRVAAVHDDGAMTVEHRRHHGRVTLPDDYVRAHVELDYSRTIRRAQGMTVDHAHLIVDPQLNREDLYVGLSRARQGTQLYVVTMTDPGPDHQPESAGATRDVLTRIITRTGSEPSASEAIRDAVAGIGDLRRMAVEYEYALGVHVEDRYRQIAEDTHPGITAMAAHQVDTAAYTFPYVANWAHPLAAVEHVSMADIVTRTGTRVMKTANEIIAVTSAVEALPRDAGADALSARVATAASKTGELRDQSAAAAQPHFDRETLLGVVADSQDYFRRQLPRSWVPGYLGERHLAEAASSHHLGYAPQGWTRLVDHLRSLGYSDDHIEASGMATRARNGHLIDHLRDRMTIPLRDREGDLVGFTARLAPSNNDIRAPKYLNSPTTSIFRKSEVLYGLAEHRTKISNGARPVVCEGPLDAIAIDCLATSRGLQLVGLAVTGTAFSTHHAKQLLQAIDNRPICLALDGDDAGRTAAATIWRRLTEDRPREVGMAELPAGTDPASLYSSDRDDLSRCIGESRPAAAVVAERQIVAAELDGNVVRELATFRHLVPLAARLPAEQRPGFVLALAERLHIDPTDAATEAIDHNPRLLMDQVADNCQQHRRTLADGTDARETIALDHPSELTYMPLSHIARTH